MISLARLKQLSSYCTESENLTSHFGIHDESNAAKAAIAIAKAGLTVDMEYVIDVFFFNFKNKNELDRARKAVDKLIDKSKEPK